MSALRAVATTPPAPLKIDGSTEQRDEIASVVIALKQYTRRSYDDLLRASSILRDTMQATKTRRFAFDGATFELKPSSEWHCVEHKTPPPYCADQHAPGEPISVCKVNAGEPYLSVSMPKGRGF